MSTKKDMRTKVRPGDVILVGDDTWLAKIICAIDGSEACHAAIGVGDGKMAEAGWKGLVYSPLENLRDREQIWLRRLPGDLDMAPVVIKAKTFTDEGHGYAYHQLVLIAAIFFARKAVTGNWVVRKAADIALDQAARLLNALVSAGKQPMICSEFVYRCYDEALPGEDQYDFKLQALKLFGFAATPAPPKVNAGSPADMLLHASPEVEKRMSFARVATAEAETATPDEILEQARAELEPLIGQLDEATRQRATVSPDVATESGVSDEQLKQHAERFARALVRSTHTDESVRSLRSLTGSDLLNQIVYKSADFVTPADLLKTAALVDGELFTGAQA